MFETTVGTDPSSQSASMFLADVSFQNVDTQLFDNPSHSLYTHDALDYASDMAACYPNAESERLHISNLLSNSQRSINPQSSPQGASVTSGCGNVATGFLGSYLENYELPSLRSWLAAVDNAPDKMIVEECAKKSSVARTGLTTEISYTMKAATTELYTNSQRGNSRATRVPECSPSSRGIVRRPSVDAGSTAKATPLSAAAAAATREKHRLGALLRYL